MRVIFECLNKGKKPLNAQKFSGKLKPGYCFGMTLDWAKTSLRLNGVKALAQLDAFKWPIIQSSYEINQHSGAGDRVPDEAGMIKANGLRILNGSGNGAEVPFNQNFRTLATQLAAMAGTSIFILFGAPGAGAHFMGLRNDGAYEFFDPNDALVSFGNQLEMENYLAGYLDFTYNGKHPNDPTLNDFCGLSQVSLS